MANKNYATLGEFVGKLSKKQIPDPWAYKRAQYAKLLLKENPIAA